MTEQFIQRLKELEKICPHFHLSLQSGCDETLKRMNRKYETDEVRKVIQNLRKNFQDAILTADIIVGFPGETEEEFEQTYTFLKEIKLYKIHVFQYSKRENTVAANLENQVLSEIKEKRSKILLELSDENIEQYNKLYIGKNVKVLVEESDENCYKGHTENYLYVIIKNNQEDIKNTIVNAKIIATENSILIGERCEL